MNNNQLIILLIIFTSFSACRSKLGTGTASRYSKAYKDAFVEGYKTLTFCKCVDYGNSSIENIAQEDVSCRVPDYLYAEVKMIDSLARVETGKINLDSADRVGRVAEGMEGKRIIDHCLELYQSKQLEKLALAKFRKDEK